MLFCILHTHTHTPYRANTSSVTKYVSTTSFLRTLRRIPSSRWTMIYVIMFLFADFYIGRREIAPQNLPMEHGRIEKMGGWGTARSPNKVLSTHTPRKGHRGHGRQEAKGRRSQIVPQDKARGMSGLRNPRK